MKKKSVTKKNPTGQSPSPKYPVDGVRKGKKTKNPKGLPVKNYST